MRTRSLVLLTFCTATLALFSIRAGDPLAQSLAAPTFTAAQQNAGEAIYKESCATCHGANLDDGEFGPPLKGVDFRSAWFGGSADILFEKIETMPPAAPGSLGSEKHAGLLAYLMSQNQLIASQKPLPSDVDQLKGMLLPGATGGPSGGLSPSAVLPPALRLTNPLAMYSPVTDALLQNPPPGEWPTWRRGYDGQGFSPLKQINRQNVGTLRSAWSWALPNGPNESTPLFHDGVLFVHAYGDKVQALDAVNGDLLWQYSRRLPTGVSPTVKRAIAIYGSNVYMRSLQIEVTYVRRPSDVATPAPNRDGNSGGGSPGRHIRIGSCAVVQSAESARATHGERRSRPVRADASTGDWQAGPVGRVDDRRAGMCDPRHGSGE